MKEKYNEELLNKLLQIYTRDRNNTKLRNQIVEMNIKLVKYTIYSFFRNTDIDEKELMSLGYFGLIGAVETFDFKYNTRFSTYAVKCIQNYISNHMYTLFDFSTSYYISQVFRAKNLIERTTGVKLGPNSDKIIDEDSFCKNETKESLKKFLNHDNINYDDVKETYDMEEIDDKIDAQSMISKVLEGMNNLSEQEREIIKLRFGFYGDSLTLKDISGRYNLSHQRIDQINKKSISKIKRNITFKEKIK